MSRSSADASEQTSTEAATERLAAYATTLRYDDIPPAVIERAKHCLIDAVGCVVFGQQFPWSQIVLAEALSSGSGGPCRLPGVKDGTFHVPQAALALGTLAHAFEFDNLRKPKSGGVGMKREPWTCQSRT